MTATSKYFRPHRVAVASCVLSGGLFLLGGCATATGGSPGQRLDPFESWNRKVFGFNESLDAYVLKPVATGYSKVVPKLARTGVDNVFNNLSDAWSAVNNLLQGKPAYGVESAMRFATNSFFGIFGIFDVASEAGMERHTEDFGQTLGVWGFGAGAYIVWPLLGPSSVRDSVALPVDWTASPSAYVDGRTAVIGVTALNVINTRANLLGASRVLDDIALDKYTFVRDAYLQRRRSLVYDGDAPPLPPAAAPVGDANAPAAASAPSR